jgi:hypothetical protein
MQINAEKEQEVAEKTKNENKARPSAKACQTISIRV